MASKKIQSSQTVKITGKTAFVAKSNSNPSTNNAKNITIPTSGSSTSSGPVTRNKAKAIAPLENHKAHTHATSATLGAKEKDLKQSKNPQIVLGYHQLGDSPGWWYPKTI